MTTPNVSAKNQVALAQPELEEELRQAEQDFQCGDFIELTVEELGQCIMSGKWPWPEESSA